MESNTVCHHCDKKIYKRPSHLKQYKIHFCNSECQKVHQQSLNKNKSVNCAECNNSIVRTQQQLKRSISNNFFCNNVCKNRFLIKNRWHGKKNVIDHHSRRNTIIKKYNNSCVNCKYDEDIRMLDIHHIDGNHSNNEFDNLWSVCVWCHTQYHRCKAVLKNNL